MRLIKTWLPRVGVAALCLLGIQNARAWNVNGSVECVDLTPFPNVTITVMGTNCNGSFTGSGTTDNNGNYVVPLPNCTGCYTATIDTSTLPPGTTLVSPATGSVCVNTTTPSGTVSFTVNSPLCVASPDTVSGTVLCPNGTPYPGVTLDVTGSSCSGPFSATVTTAANGTYSLQLPNCAGCYTISLNLTTFPPGATIVSVVASANTPVTSSPTNFCLNSGSDTAGIFWQVNSSICNGGPPPPPCTNCVDPALNLGAASGTGVFELSTGSVSITGPAGGVISEINMAPNSKLSLTGSEYVTGTINLGSGATFSDSSSGTIGTVNHNVDLSAAIATAYAANTADAALPCTQSFTTLDGKTVKTITGVSGVNVICVQNITLSGTQILLTGPSDAKFIFNITGKLAFTGGGFGPQIRVDSSSGIQPSAVLYNFIGTGQDVALNGGGGGVNCCAAIIDGTILAPHRNIALSPGLVNGGVISGLNISIVSGSSVHCPPCP
jgi:choice-of-anchor A domain-containing protein